VDERLETLFFGFGLNVFGHRVLQFGEADAVNPLDGANDFLHQALAVAIGFVVAFDL
jgi:hypothetical protein